MTLRLSDDDARNPVHVEVARPDELPAPVADEAAPLKRRSNGTIADSATAKALGARGGAAKAGRARLIDALGLAKLAEDAAFAPYRRAADEFHEHHVAELATCGGGKCGAGPSSMVATASLQLAASRYLFDKAAESVDAGLFMLASRLGNDSRQNLLAAYELAVREATARKQSAAHAGRAKLFVQNGKGS